MNPIYTKCHHSSPVFIQQPEHSFDLIYFTAFYYTFATLSFIHISITQM
jgi:hypothetical protein